ncbi:MAG: hypothetical protein U0984_04970 [Prosthecobacter sp.]|nr:hypothetical protein [Prosthecobacter sp.]
MSISRRTKVVSLMVLLVLVSVVFGFVTGAIVAKQVAKKKDDPRFWKQVALKQLEKLHPTEAQRQKFEARVDGAVEELIAIRKDTITRAEAAVAKAAIDIAQDLTPEQREIFDKIKPKPKPVAAE